MSETTTHELYKKYRPATLDQVIGQDSAIAIMKKFIEKKRVPHAALFHGPFGCGKTSLARILSKAINCHPDECVEVDSAQFKGIDSARELREQVCLMSMHGGPRVWIIDEAHEMTKVQQDAMLKVMEDTPKHVYIWLATTEPDKINKGLRTRCTPIEVVELTPEDLTKKVLWPVCVREKRLDFPKPVLTHIGQHCSGSARAALVQLDAVWDLEDEATMLTAVKRMSVDEDQVQNLAKLLLSNAPWPVVAAALKTLPGEPESIRYGILGYMTAATTGWMAKNPKRPAEIMVCFEKNYYDTKKNGLTISCLYACGVL